MAGLKAFIVAFFFYFILLQENVISTGGFPKGFLNEIVESPVVQNRLESRWKWEVWDVVPGTHTYNIYIFNLTNPDEVERGRKPIFQEVGPYAYVEHRIKFNVSVNLDLSVNYQRNFTYTFDPDQSNGTENDLVTTLNVPFIIFSKFANGKGSSGNQAVNSLVAKGEGFLKRNIRVGDLLFNGIDIRHYAPLLLILDLPPSPLRTEFESGRYGVLKLKAGSYEGPFTVDSGLNERSNLGKIRSWDGDTKLNNWYGPSCDAINGTDGTVLPPFVSNTEPISILDVDLCRSITFLFDHYSTFESSVPTYNFNLDPSLFADPRLDYASRCFCNNSADENFEKCLRAGVLDVSSCRDGAPYVMSMAHFYLADPFYLENVIGIQPIESRDQTSIVVQPRLGVVVEYFRRFQWNMEIEHYNNLDYYRNVNFKEILFPILWNDDHFQLDEDKAELMVSEIANELGGYGNNRGSCPVHDGSIISIFFIISLTFILILH